MSLSNLLKIGYVRTIKSDWVENSIWKSRFSAKKAVFSYSILKARKSVLYSRPFRADLIVSINSCKSGTYLHLEVEIIISWHLALVCLARAGWCFAPSKLARKWTKVQVWGRKIVRRHPISDIVFWLIVLNISIYKIYTSLAENNL